MAAIIFPNRWARQPSAECGPNGGNPITVGLKSLVNFGASLRDVVNGALCTTIQAPTRTAAAGCVGFALNGTNQAIDLPRTYASAAGTLFLLTFYPAAPTGSQCTATQNASSDGNIGAGWQGVSFFGGGTSVVSGGFPVGLRALGGTWGANINISVDAAIESGPGTGASTGNTQAFTIGCFNYSGGRLFFTAQTAMMFAAWDRQLQYAELRALAQNPWQIFRPLHRRIYVPSAAAGQTIDANAALIEANDVLISSVSAVITGTAAIAEASDVLTSAVTATITASATLVEANDLLTADVSVAFPGAIAAASLTEADDSLISSVSVVVTASAAITEAADVLSSTAAVTITASAALLEANDTLAAEGGTASFAIAAMTERDDALTATGTVLVTGTAAISEASDVLASAATVSITATAALQEANDLLTAAGSVGTVVRTADAALQEANDTLAAAAVSTISASAAILEAGDIIVSGVTILVTANAALVEANDGLTGSGMALFGVFADAALREANDTMTSAVVQKIARRIAASDALRGGIAASDAGRWTITPSDGLN